MRTLWARFLAWLLPRPVPIDRDGPRVTTRIHIEDAARRTP